jgi:N-acetylmuramoyl-L-alanine amidase
MWAVVDLVRSGDTLARAPQQAADAAANAPGSVVVIAVHAEAAHAARAYGEEVTRRARRGE